MKLYVNGVLEGTVATTAVAANTVNPVQIGGNSNQGYYFPGLMDDVRFYGQALSANEVLNLFNTGSNFGLAGAPPVDSTVNNSLMRAAVVTGQMLELSWDSQPGRTYHVQSTDDLAARTWTDLAGEFLATESSLKVTLPMDETFRRFYRVVLLP